MVPFAELYLLIRVGEFLGAGWTVLLVILTGVSGAWLARTQGVNTLLKVRRILNSGELPANELVEGLLILVAGILLITPGLITDVVGLLLLLPVTRMPIARGLREYFMRSARWHAASGKGSVYYAYSQSATRTDTASDQTAQQQVVIDCEPAANGKPNGETFDCDAGEHGKK